VRVPTWAPFRLQIYFNGHDWLSRQLDKKGNTYVLADNVFLNMDDFSQAQEIVDSFSVERLHRKLDRFAREFCPLQASFRSGYHWSLMQIEYATDIVFRSQEALADLYENLVRTAIHAVKAENVATFLGRKLDGRFQGELGNDFQTRIEGTRIKHHMREVSIKMYDKFGLVLRIETTANKVSFFKHHRKVEHRNGKSELKNAPVRKSIYSIPVLQELMEASNRRYLEFISEIQDPTSGLRNLTKIAKTVRQEDRTYRGFNLFSGDDLELFLALLRGEYNISGFTNRTLRAFLHGKAGPQVSRLLKRLRVHGLIRRVPNTYKYYLTKLGRRVILTALKLREAIVIPGMSIPA